MKIIVIDNDQAALAETATFLQGIYPKAEICPFDDGMDAVQHSFNHPVDVVYTEVLMPHITGFDAARLVRKFRPGTAVCIVTSTAEYLDRAKKQGLSGYYLKPLIQDFEQTDNLLDNEKKGASV